MTKQLRLGNLHKALATLLLLCSLVWAQGPGHNYHNGRHHNEDWPDSLTTISVTGVAIIDTLMAHPRYFLESNFDDSVDYQLGFGPWWYEPASGATLPEDGDSVSIIGGLNDDMTPGLLVVFEINGLVWRDSTGAPPWSGGWVHHDANDTSWINCPTDSMDHLGFPPQSMMGMMWPDSLYCQFEEMDPDSMPGMTDSTMFEGYLCNFNTEMGGQMGNGMGMMNFDRSLHFQFHYIDSMLNQQRLDENSIQLLYLDDNFIWQPISDYDIDTDANLITVNSETVAEYYVLKVNSSTVGIDQSPAQLLPQTVEIETAFPNPFNPTATITYSLNETGSVAIQVFDLQGKLIISNQTLKSAGKHNFEWNAQNNFGQSVASGTYLIKVSSGNSNAIRMITLIR